MRDLSFSALIAACGLIGAGAVIAYHVIVGLLCDRLLSC